MKYFLLFSLLTLSLAADTLDALISYATEHSTLIRQSEVQREMAKLNHKMRKSERFGELDVVGNYTHYNLPRTLAPLTPDTIKSGVPVTTTKDLYSAGLMYNLPLFTGFAQTRAVEIEHLAQMMADAKANLTKEQLVYNIRALYLTVLSLKERKSAQQAYAEALESLRKQIAYEVKLGKKAKVDLLKADATLQGAKTQVRLLDANIAITRATLSSLVGKKVGELSPVAIRISAPKRDQKLHETQLENLTKMRVEALSVQKAQKMVDKSKALYYPQIALSAYIGKNYGEDLKTEDMENETLWQAGLNLKYNLFDFGKRSNSIQKAKIAKLQASIHKEQQLLELKKELVKALAQIDQNHALYLGNRAAYTLRQESEKIEQVRYEHGASTLNDLLLAKGKTKQAEAQMIESRYNYQKSIYFLDYLLERGTKHEDQ